MEMVAQRLNLGVFFSIRFISARRMSGQSSFFLNNVSKSKHDVFGIVTMSEGIK